MKLGRIDTVINLAERRKHLLHQITVVAGPDGPDDDAAPNAPRYRVMIDGELQDLAIRSLLRPVLLAELAVRVAVIDFDLAGLGVEAEDYLCGV